MNDVTGEVDGARIEFPEYEALMGAVGIVGTDDVQVAIPSDTAATHSSVAPVKKETVPVGTPTFDATAAW
jgi:hypothetical protein